jgi:hypothetical protein
MGYFKHKAGTVSSFSITSSKISSWQKESCDLQDAIDCIDEHSELRNFTSGKMVEAAASRSKIEMGQRSTMEAFKQVESSSSSSSSSKKAFSSHGLCSCLI